MVKNIRWYACWVALAVLAGCAMPAMPEPVASLEPATPETVEAPVASPEVATGVAPDRPAVAGDPTMYFVESGT